VLLIP